MTKLTLPMPGELIPSEMRPGVVKCARVTVGPAATNDVVATTAGTYAVATLPANAVILNIASRVVTAFTASVTLTLGDSDSAAGYLASADIAPQTASAIMVNSRGAGEAYAGGKVYDAEQDVNLVLAAATAVVGQLDVYIEYALAGAH